MTQPSPPSATADREMIASCLVDAPREQVWKVWTEPDLLAQWWGPHGFTNLFETFDLRPGGEWRFVMRGPDGKDYQNHIVFEALEAPARLVMDHTSGPRFRIEATFADRGGKTEVTFRGIFETVKEYDAVKGYAIEGNRQTLERMAHLAALQSERAFVQSATYDASAGQVWKAWTDAGSLARWWGPKGLALRVARLELTPGGLFHYAMTTPDGHELWGRFVYLDVVAPRRLVFTVAFSDAEAGLTRHPMSATWPLETLNSLDLEEHEGRTTLTLRAVPVRASAEERRTFEGGFASMQQGFKGTFDQLAAYLAQA